MRPAVAGSNGPQPVSAAGFLRRIGALLYESLLLAALLLVSGFLFLPLIAPAGPADRALTIPALPSRVMSFCLMFAVLAFYCVILWSGHRRTLAMKTWGIGLVRRDGTALDRRTALLRYLAAWLGPLAALATYFALVKTGFGAYALAPLFLNYVWALLDADRQFLHDRLAGTRMVRAWPPPRDRILRSSRS
ncbi:MAG: RDD family protein [Betaproteobacteria bacterium]